MIAKGRTSPCVEEAVRLTASKPTYASSGPGNKRQLGALGGLRFSPRQHVDPEIAL